MGGAAKAENLESRDRRRAEEAVAGMAAGAVRQMLAFPAPKQSSPGSPGSLGLLHPRRALRVTVALGGREAKAARSGEAGVGAMQPFEAAALRGRVKAKVCTAEFPPRGGEEQDTAPLTS